MCLAIYKKQGEKLNLKKIKLAWNNNPHGSGIAIKYNHTIKVIKGIMKLDELIEIIEKNDHFKGYEALIHLRYSTSGGYSPTMTHPFPISKKNDDLLKIEYNTDKALIHNGVLFNPILNNYSDTAIFSRYLAYKDNHKNDELINSLIGRDKVAIFETGKPTRLFGKWEEIDGVFYSNTHSFYEEKNFNFGNYDHDEDFIDCCPLCESEDIFRIGVYSKTYECGDCYSVFNEKYFLENIEDNFFTHPKYKLG